MDRPLEKCPVCGAIHDEIENHHTAEEVLKRLREIQPMSPLIDDLKEMMDRRDAILREINKRYVWEKKN